MYVLIIFLVHLKPKSCFSLIPYPDFLEVHTQKLFFGLLTFKKHRFFFLDPCHQQRKKIKTQIPIKQKIVEKVVVYLYKVIYDTETEEAVPNVQMWKGDVFNEESTLQDNTTCV